MSLLLRLRGGVGPVSEEVRQGGLHKRPYLKASFKGIETEEQKQLRREAQGIIARIKKAEPRQVVELQQEAEDISWQLQEAISRLEIAAEAFGIALEQKQQQLAMEQAQQLQDLMIESQLQAELMRQQVEEIDVAYITMMIAAHI